MDKEERELIEEHVYVNMTPAEELTWIQLNGTKPVLLPRKAYHQHALMAAERNVLEAIAHIQAHKDAERIHLGVLCVGACPARERHYCDPAKDWFMIPILSASDRRRDYQTPEEWKSSKCNHKLGDCGSSHLRHFGTSVFVHSAYYIPFDLLWEHIQSLGCGHAYVIGHHFEEAFGGFYDEAVYEFDGRVVSTVVRGNTEAYVHEPLPWLIGKVMPSGRKLEADLVEKRGCTYLWRVTAVLTKTSPDSVIRFESVRADPNQYGPIQFSSGAKARVLDDARVQNISIDVDHLWKFGPVVFSESKEMKVTIPVNVITELASFMLGKTRDPSTLNDVLRTAAGLVKRSRVPHHLQHRAGLVAAILAFSVPMMEEIEVLQAAHINYGVWYKVHAQLLQLSPVPTARLCKFLVLLVVLVAIASALASDDTGTAHIAALVIFVLVLALSCLFVCIRQSTKLYHDYKHGNFKRAVMRHEASSTLNEPLISYSRDYLFPGSTEVRDPNVAVAPNAVVTLDEERPRERYAKPPTRMIESGICFDNAIPTVIEPNQYSELSAIVHRYAMEVPEFQPWVDQFLREACKQPEFDFSHIDVQETEVRFRNWVNGLEQNQAYKDKMLDEFKRLHESPPQPRASKVFMKLELTTKPITNMVDYFAKKPKPRMIQAPDDDVKARLGYIIAQVYKGVCKIWSPKKDSRIVYCSGLTPDEIGERVHQFIEEHGEVEAIENDMESYDATVRSDLSAHAYKKYAQAGVSASSIEWLDCTQTRGRTPHGVVYEIMSESDRPTEKMILSGQPDTNLLGTIVNVMVFLACLIWLYMQGHFAHYMGKKGTFVKFASIPFLMLACGDDNIIFFPVGLLRPDSQQLITRFLTACGLKPCVIRRSRLCDMTFCSKLFWPAINPKTGKATIVLGAPPGRILYRHGWATTHAGSLNLASKTLGARIDNAHVPFVRDYLETTYKMCVKQKIRPNANREYSNFKTASQRFMLDPARSYKFAADRYNIDPAVVEADFKDLLDKVTEVPCVLHCPLLDKLVAIDMELSLSD